MAGCVLLLRLLKWRSACRKVSLELGLATGVETRVTSPKGAKTRLYVYFVEYLAASAAKYCKGRVGIA